MAGTPIIIPSVEGFTLGGKAFPRYDGVDAVRGTGTDVSTLDGRFLLKVPAGMQPDTALRLRGKGLPRFGGGSRGDLYVRLQVHVPERLSERHRRLFERLGTPGSQQVKAKP